MALYIHHMNARYLTALVLSMPNSGLLRISEKTLRKKMFWKNERGKLFVQHVVNEIILKGKKEKLSVKNETREHENIGDNINKKELYELDTFSLEEKK